MRVFREESGQALVFTALCMTVLLGFMALAIDVGLLFRARRNVQIVADAAAVAAALDYKYNGVVSSAKAAGQAAATANGMTNGVGGVTVAINLPPSYGPYASSTGFAEAIVIDPSPTTFMHIFTHSSSADVSSRAVAGAGSTSGCMWTLDRSGTDVSLTGSGAISAPSCDIYDDSSASSALTLTGSGSIDAKAVGVVGGYNETGSGSISPTPVTGIAPAADPLSGLPVPTIPTGTCSSSCTQSNTGSGNLTISQGTYTNISNTGSGTLTLNPGNYIITGSLTNTGSGSLILGAGNYTIDGNFSSTGSTSLTLGAGLYIVEGNLTLTGSGSMTGSGVTFYTEGTTAVTGSGGMNLTAPTSGTYSGVLFFQSRTDSSSFSLTGSGGDKIQGILYAPDSALSLTGSGSLSVALDMITDSLSVTGSGTITDANYAVTVNSNSVLSRLALVE